jgi:hypothetical protein
MGHKFVKSTFLLSILLISGCAVRHYQEPLSGDVAYLEIHNFADVKVALATYGSSDICTEQQGIGEFKANTGLRLKLSTDKIFTITARYLYSVSGTNYYGDCGQTISFMPEKDKSYKAAYDLSGGECSIILKSVENDRGGVQDVNYIVRTYKIPFFEREGFCYPMSRQDSSKLLSEN